MDIHNYDNLHESFARKLADDRGMTVEIKLSTRRQTMVMQLSAILGISSVELYNAAVRYTIYVARTDGANKLADTLVAMPEYPQRLRGKTVSYEMTAETRGVIQVLGARPLHLFDVGRATVAGITLLYDAVRVRQPVGRPRKVAVAQ